MSTTARASRPPEREPVSTRFMRALSRGMGERKSFRRARGVRERRRRSDRAGPPAGRARLREHALLDPPAEAPQRHGSPPPGRGAHPRHRLRLRPLRRVLRADAARRAASSASIPNERASRWRSASAEPVGLEARVHRRRRTRRDARGPLRRRLRPRRHAPHPGEPISSRCSSASAICSRRAASSSSRTSRPSRTFGLEFTRAPRSRDGRLERAAPLPPPPRVGRDARRRSASTSAWCASPTCCRTRTSSSPRRSSSRLSPRLGAHSPSSTGCPWRERRSSRRHGAPSRTP